MATSETESCRLLGGIFASFIQACLALLCIATLIVKRQQEVPRRDWLVWFLDVMKQGLGASFGHFSNIYLSMIIAKYVVAGDECQWYCLTYVIDCTLGTCLNLTFLHLFERLLRRFPNCRGLLTFGEYGDPPQLSIWFPQLLVWLSFVITSKTIIVLTLSQLITPIDAIISELFYPLRNQPRLELVTVMIIIPTILNTLQFWVTDTFLKHRTDRESVRLLSDDCEGDSPLDEELISDDEAIISNNKQSRCKHKKPKNWKSGQIYTQLGSSSPMSTAASDDIENDLNNSGQNYFVSLVIKAVHSVQPAMNSMLSSTGINRFWRRHMTNPRQSSSSSSSSSLSAQQQRTTSRTSGSRESSSSRPTTPQQQFSRRRGGTEEWKYATDGIELGGVPDYDDTYIKPNGGDISEGL